MVPDELSFRKLYKYMMYGQRLNWSDPELRSRLGTFVGRYSLVGTNAFCCLLLAYSVIYHDIKKDDLTEAFKNCFITMVGILVYFKYCLLINNQDTVIRIITKMNDVYKNIDRLPIMDRRVVLGSIEKSAWICKIWLILSLGTSVMFPLKAVFLMVYSYYKGDFKLYMVFPGHLPPFLDFANEMPHFLGLFCVQMWFATFAASVFMGFEPLALTFILHACGQLEVAKNKIDRIYAQQPHDPERTVENLKECIVLLQDVFKFVDMINGMNVILYDVNIKLTVIGMPLVFFQVLEAFKRYRINIEFVSFLFGCVVHIFIPCYYSDLLMEKGEEVRQAMYQCGWERFQDLRSRKILVMMMTRGQRASVIQTAFTVINLDAFADAMRQAFTIFNLLNAAN